MLAVSCDLMWTSPKSCEKCNTPCGGTGVRLVMPVDMSLHDIDVDEDEDGNPVVTFRLKK